ncbi:uncharacterized protein J8A68_001439 [[Candida] subhashii]|uniref:Uncharacterized protein n=1 Tax=[Candida] subhashii TaxID=561895 RepID=A0A8J5QI29_9ASCO|nr:uncharacterized protein J8A68_001439 [[Candida] subhashii]KAG7665031.1 hypothetical protein J8A68_001439 [[Candida] subhashii]
MDTEVTTNASSKPTSQQTRSNQATSNGPQPPLRSGNDHAFNSQSTNCYGLGHSKESVLPMAEFQQFSTRKKVGPI